MPKEFVVELALLTIGFFGIYMVIWASLCFSNRRRRRK